MRRREIVPPVPIPPFLDGRTENAPKKRVLGLPVPFWGRRRNATADFWFTQPLEQSNVPPRLDVGGRPETDAEYLERLAGYNTPQSDD